MNRNVQSRKCDEILNQKHEIKKICKHYAEKSNLNNPSKLEWRQARPDVTCRHGNKPSGDSKPQSWSEMAASLKFRSFLSKLCENGESEEEANTADVFDGRTREVCAAKHDDHIFYVPE